MKCEIQTAGSHYNISILTSHFHSCMISCVIGLTANILLLKSEGFCAALMRSQPQNSVILLQFLKQTDNRRWY